MTEQQTDWMPIPCAPGYQITSSGCIRRRINVRHKHRGKPYAFLKGERDKDGYQRVTLNGRHYLVHRLVYLTFCGPLEDGKVICHADGDLTNNRFDNLIQATQAENISHKRLHGTWQAGEKHPRAKYTQVHIEKVRTAALLAPRGPSGKIKRGWGVKLANEFGVSPQLISRLLHQNAWVQL